MKEVRIMGKNHVWKKVLSVVLVLCMIMAWALPANAAGVTFTKVSNDRVSANLLNKDAAYLNGNLEYAPTDVVRVSIFLDKAGVLGAGFTAQDLADNTAAMNYRAKLEKEQTSVIGKIEKATKEKLDVVWNLTIATNLISANVQFGQIEAISKVKGVSAVVVETQYLPDVVSSAEADPNMGTSGAQTGAINSYAAGYTGAGSRVAIIDTGLDTDHQSFNATAFNYSLSNIAGKAGMSPEDYIAGLELLDAEEIASVLSKLNATARANVSAEAMYISSKIPFAFNYVDSNTNVTHMNDAQGEHGSHVAGIATANSYIYNADGTFSNALDTVHVQGVAPDAQVMVMKVFGAKGGAYEADYMAAIEDAILLGADSINLSLGSANPGMSSNSTAKYQAIMEGLEKCGVVVCMSAGNNGGWADAAQNGSTYMYLDDVSMQSGGSPGSYTNSLSVGSVDNSGYDAAHMPILIANGKSMIYYESAEYGNAPLAGLSGTHEYVFLNGIGTPEEFASLGEGALAGKIAICYRGTTSFFEKANAAVEAGAIAVIIVNNQAGIIGLNLTGYLYTAPVVSLTLADGEAYKSNPTTDDAGNVLCWTGTMEIPNEGIGQFDQPYHTMSSFSSWGVPGSLVLKPEITAPGGNILSVAGAYKGGVSDHVSYELMSGTSMAAPQVTGMVAVVAQYIRENDLTTLTGLDARTLAQSLLMSTAVPMMDGNNAGYYYPVLQQGAGLANVGAATMADSYILMNEDATASYADGKVKVELGDDPNKTGVYTFSFTINNMTDGEKTYALSADFFTQSAFAAYDGLGQVKLYMDTFTTALAPMVTYTVNGKELEGSADMFGMDFNGDGYVNSADGQALLDFAAGALAAITNADKADLNADGTVGSYDAYLFFQMLGKSGATVAANGSATVEVTVKLSNDDHAWLSNYPSGAYLEGYVYAESVVDAEGVAGTCHSIPVLGFYGNWSDASMFDKLSYEDLLTGTVTLPYLYESAYSQGLVNGLFITYGDEPGMEYYFGGNPIFEDDVYMPERNAISGANGDMISTIGFTSIRNAAASYYQIIDWTNLQYLVNEPAGAVSSAYYHVNQGAWKNTYWELGVGANMASVADNTLLELGITLIPEYYVDKNGNVDWNSLGDGVTFSMTMTVDHTAPVLEDVSLSLLKNTMTITATDNQYIAAVVLLDSFGEEILVSQGSQADAKAGDTCEYVLDLANVNGAGFLLQVYDYAMNCTTYEINSQIGTVVDTVEEVAISESSMTMQKGNTAKLKASVLPTNASNRTVTWSSSDESIATVAADGTVVAVGVGSANITATSVLDPNVSATCRVEVIDVAVDLNAFIWDEAGSIWYSTFNTATLPDYTKLVGDFLSVDYMAAATITPDGTIIACSMDSNTFEGTMYSFNPNTYEIKKLTDCMVQGMHVFYSDLAYAPNLYGTGMDALLATYGPYVIALDPVTGEYLEVIDQYDTDLVGITVCYGEYSDEYRQSEVCAYVVDSKGVLTQELYCHLPDYGMTLPFYSYMYGVRMSMSTGINLGETWFFNSLHYDAEKAMVFWSAFDTENDDSVTLYAIDEMSDFAIYNLGTFGENVWPAAGLHAPFAAAAPEDAGANTASLIEKVRNQAADARGNGIEISAINKANESSHAELNVATGNNLAIDAGEDMVTLDLTAKDLTGADVASTNGVATVTFDSAALSLKAVMVNGDYTSVVQDNGSVTFAYVKMDGFAATDVVATLIFDVIKTDDTSVKVHYSEVNDAYPDYTADMSVSFPHANTHTEGYKAPTCTENGFTGNVFCSDCGKQLSNGVPIPATGHNYGDVTYSWSEDYSTYTATRSCACNHTETAHATVTSKTTDPNCTEDGSVTYTATFAETWAEGATVTVGGGTATGHSYADATYEWSEDHSTCTATRTCACGHSETAAATVTSQSADATCTEDGTVTYTATFTESWATTQTATVVSATAPGHSYGDVTYAWSEDHSTYTATRTCACGHVETVHATVTSQTTGATCTEAGFVTYTATFAESWAEGAIATAAGDPATGHADADNNGACDHCNADLSNAKTGDTFMTSLGVLAALASVTALAVLMVNRKKFVA